MVRKIGGRSTDLRPRKYSRAGRVSFRSPLGLAAFRLLRPERKSHFAQHNSSHKNAKSQLVSDQ